MGSQGDLDRRNRNARPDGDARGIRAAAAAARRAHRRLAAHDDPDRGVDRDAHGARRRRALGLVQHLFDPGPRRRRGRRCRHPGVRRQGRESQRVLGIHPSHFRVGRRRRAEHDPRRRRRCDPPHASRHAAERATPRPAPSGQRGRGSAVRRDQEAAEGEAAGWFSETRQENPGVTEETTTGVHRLYQMEKEGRCSSRPSTSTTASPSRSSTISTAAASHWSTASAAAPT